MIINSLIFITFLCISGSILYHYVKKIWYITRTIRYMELQKIMMEKGSKTKGKQVDEKVSDNVESDDDVMFN